MFIYYVMYSLSLSIYIYIYYLYIYIYRERERENVYVLAFSADFRPSQLDIHVTNSGEKYYHIVAPGMSPTHPERCATEICARKYHKCLGIFHLRPDRDKTGVQKVPQTGHQCTQHLVPSTLNVC